MDVTEGGLKRFTLNDKSHNLGAHIQDMEIAGIDLAVLSCPVGWDTSLEDCQQINDHLAQVQREYPNRFVGLAHIPVHEGRKGIRELEQAVRHLGLKGVSITSQVKGEPTLRPHWD